MKLSTRIIIAIVAMCLTASAMCWVSIALSLARAIGQPDPPMIQIASLAWRELVVTIAVITLWVTLDDVVDPFRG